MPEDKWWDVRLKVQAATASDALNGVRRYGATTVSEAMADTAEPPLTYESVKETGTPWRPASTAPKDGRPFIAFDDNIGYAETARWDAQQRKFLNFVGDKEARFTRWMEQPTTAGDRSQ